MARDVMYYFDKVSPYARHELGEIQTDFNMGLTIDGDKDSEQVQVFNFEEKEIEPNTILYHQSTNTWWIVKRDIVKRNAHEEGFYYTHNLTLNGAINLLNVRDLVDCGFNDKTYTIDDFIKRLFKLSTFEFTLTINYGNNIDETNIVDYIKSFENYTLLSALREFLNGYNCESKLTFEVSGNNYHISNAILTIIPRTGNVDLQPIDISHFDDIRETKTENQESYGTTVVSNAQNVVSTETKTYPQIGGVGLSADKYKINNMSDGYVKLPTPAYKVNWVKAISPVNIVIVRTGEARSFSTNVFYPQSESAFNEAFEDLYNRFRQSGASTTAEVLKLLEQKEKIRNIALGLSCITFYSGFDYNPHTHAFTKWESTPYLALLRYQASDYTNMVLADKETHDCFQNPSLHGLYWERGKDKIEGFNTFSSASGDTYYPTRTDVILTGINTNMVELSENRYYVFVLGNVYADTEIDDVGYGQASVARVNHIGLKSTLWQVNYIPMSDIKIKQDNKRFNIDSKIYNQNGKLNDGVALAKLIDSHAKEIESDNITRYMHYTNFNDIPKIGQLVNNNGEMYVINNISYDFYANELNVDDDNVSYYIECEFTMSKYVSVKSLMVNPNSNIRDYGIPQKYNIKRRQVYRDYYELSFENDLRANTNVPYVNLNHYLKFGNEVVNEKYDHTAFIKIDYNEQVDGHTSWYYQLNTTSYVLGKSLYEVIDFNDNNIIGYDMQNTKTGFNMNDIWNPNIYNINTPVSYVDDKGRVKGITLEMLNPQNVYDLYESVRKNSSMPPDYELSSHCFIGEEMFYGLIEPQNDSENGHGQWQAIQYDVEYEERFEKPTNYILNSASVSNVIVKDSFDRTITPTTMTTLIEETDNEIVVRINFSVPSGYDNDYGLIEYQLDYQYDRKMYNGAVDLKDYELKELNYNKDAIEVPVFEYSLQLGDTKDVEIGDTILLTQNEEQKLVMYSVSGYDSQLPITKLNAKKYFNIVGASSGAISDDDFAWEYSLVTTIVPVITYEDNNTKLRIKFYDSQRAIFLGDANQEYIVFEEWSPQSVHQISKNYFIGKDFVIQRHLIKTMHRDTETEETNVDYDTDLMMIIHKPKEEDFDGDDLIIKLNHYRLK